MQKNYTSIGLMSGTSGDGVDASLINSNGIDQFEVIKDKFFEYDLSIFNEIHLIKENIFNLNDLEKLSKRLIKLEREITIFHAKILNDFAPLNQEDILVGFHGQTIYHNSKKRISRQLGDAKLLHQLSKKKIVFNFRENDILNNGEGAPLAPIFHQLIASQYNINLPVCFLNIGGIANTTIVNQPIGSLKLFSKDIGPGNCLIDSWIRKNSKKKYDLDGLIGLSGRKNDIILEQAQNLYSNRINKEKRSFDTSDFDTSFARGLSLEDGAATLTVFTAHIIANEISLLLSHNSNKFKDILVCGGGRKNPFLLKEIKKNISPNLRLRLIEDYNINGDFVESQAFAFLAIRSLLKLPISFPNTTGCTKPCTGGDLIN